MAKMASCSKFLLARVLFLQANGQQTTVSVEPCYCYSFNAILCDSYCIFG